METRETRTVLVTGGGRGLGRAIAMEMASQGHALGILARTASEVESAVEAIHAAGGRAMGIVADVRDMAAVEQGCQRLRDAFGPVEVVISAAGRLRGIGPVGLADPDAWWGDLETSARGFWHVARATLGDLRQASQPVVIALVGPGTNGVLANASGYASGQAALARLVECLAAEWGEAGIPVFGLNPGLVPTAMMRHLLESLEGRLWLPGFTEAFAEGKEVDESHAVRMASWLARVRPMELSGRIVPALLDPELLDSRRVRLQEEGRYVLRLT